MDVRHLLARTPADDEAALRQAEKQALFDSMDLGSRHARHGRIGRRPAWLLAFLEDRDPKPSRIPPPEQSGRARHLAYRAAKRRAAAR